MAARGLRRGENGLELFVMCEIPSNVVLADQFAGTPGAARTRLAHLDRA
jgi:phosphoenolpyruvate synthase/pyruvate phosphate dikinase